MTMTSTDTDEKWTPGSIQSRFRAVFGTFNVASSSPRNDVNPDTTPIDALLQFDIAQTQWTRPNDNRDGRIKHPLPRDHATYPMKQDLANLLSLAKRITGLDIIEPKNGQTNGRWYCWICRNNTYYCKLARR